MWTIVYTVFWWAVTQKLAGPIISLPLSRVRSLAIQECAPAYPEHWLWQKRPGETNWQGGRL